MEQSIDLCTRLTPDDVNRLLKEIATAADPGEPLRKMNVHLGCLTRPDPWADSLVNELAPTGWEEALREVLMHGYRSAEHAGSGLSLFWCLLLDAIDPRDPRDVLNPTALRRFAVAYVFLSRLEAVTPAVV